VLLGLLVERRACRRALPALLAARCRLCSRSPWPATRSGTSSPHHPKSPAAGGRKERKRKRKREEDKGKKQEDEIDREMRER